MADARLQVIIDATDNASAQLRAIAGSTKALSSATNQMSSSVATASKTWGAFLSERMGPAMRQYGSHGAAIKALSQEYRAYKAGLTSAAIETEKVTVQTSRLKGMMSQLQSQTRYLRMAGVAMIGMGFGIAAALGMSARVTMQQEASTKGLSETLKTLGINYGTVKDKLEPLLALNQETTKFTETEQRTALETLLRLTGDYDKALSLLPLSMDIAAGKNTDLATAAEAVGEAAEGNVGKLEGYIGKLREGATPTEALSTAVAMFGDRAKTSFTDAERAVRDFRLALSELQEVIGTEVLPVVMPLIKAMTEFLKSLRDLDPALMTFIVQAALAGAAMLILLGSLAQVGAGFKIVMALAAFFLSPIGLIILAILALIAGVAVFIIYWEDFKRMWREEIWAPVVSAWQTAFETIRTAFWTAWDFIVSTAHSGINGMIAGFEDLANRAIDAANFIMAAFNRIQVTLPDWVPGLGGKTFGINLTPFPNIALPRLAEGGIVTRPTLAMIGERGPEAVVPLNRAGVTIIFNAPVYGMDDFRRKISQAIKDTWNSGGFTEMNLGRT